MDIIESFIMENFALIIVLMAISWIGLVAYGLLMNV